MKLSFPILGILLGSLLFFINSYLLLIRDLYKLEVLADVYNLPQIEEIGTKLFYSLNVNILSLALLAISFTALVLSYVFTIRLPEVKLRAIIPALIAIYLLFFLSFPILSNDIFDYHNGARILITHGQNPLITPADSFPSDNHLFLGSWQFRTIAYPPITTWLYGISYALTGGNLIASVFGFKIITTLFLILGIKLLSGILKKKVSSAQVLAIAVNPLLLIEFAGNGHNDIIMAAISLAGILLFWTKSYFKSGALLALASITKFSVVVFVPILFLKLLTKRKLKAAFLLAFGFAAAISAALFPLRDSIGPLVKTTVEQSGIVWRSFPSTLFIISQKIYPQINVLNVSNSIRAISYIIMFVVFFLVSLREKPKFELINTFVLILITYLLFASPILHPWYIAWFLLLVPLLKSKRLKLGAIVFSISALSYHLILNFSYYLSPHNILWEAVIYLAVAIPPLVVLISPAKCYTRLANFLKI